MCRREISLRLSQPFGSDVISSSLNHRPSTAPSTQRHLAAGSFITSHHQETDSLLLVPIWEDPGENPIGLMPTKEDYGWQSWLDPQDVTVRRQDVPQRGGFFLMEEELFKGAG